MADIYPHLHALMALYTPVTHPDQATARALEARLTNALTTAHARWPGISIDDQLFLQHTCEQIGPTDSWVTSIITMHLEDLFLATACTHLDPHALAALESDYLHNLTLRLHELPNHEDLTQEIHQRVWEKLIVPQADKPPRISQYSGAGALASWLQTIVTREALGVLRLQKRQQPVQEDIFWRIACPQGDQEAQFLKQVYRDAFQEAFQRALQTLAPRDRTTLKYHYIDGLSTEQIGRIYRVHRATVARWLERIREELLALTSANMHQEMGLSLDAANSIFHLIQSQLDLSIIRVLEK